MRHIASIGQLAAFAALITAAGAATPPTQVVPLIGPAFLSNFDPTNSDAIKNATEAFPKAIENLFDSGALNKTDLVFAVDVFSAATNSSLFSYQHVGEGQEQVLTAGKVDDQTIGRTGSVTKLFTAYALLVKAGIGIFDVPVTHYLPELRRVPSAGEDGEDDLIERIRWEEITIGALASHQAGSGGGGALFAENLGEEESMTPEDLFTHMRDVKHPVISPYRNAMYSDAGYFLLGQVLARISGQSYGDAIQEILCKPLGMEHISVTTPEGEGVNAINRTVVSNESSFGLNIPVAVGSGSIFANGADLRTLGLSILNSELLSAATTQQWMKPKSSTGSLVELVGAPWEIQRLAIPLSNTSNATRISDLYTKAGGNGDYTCVLALSPDHGIGFSILVAGETASTARWPLRNTLGDLFIPAAETASAANAAANLAGTFVHPTQHGTNLTLSTDFDNDDESSETGGGLPGLGLQSLYLNGTESRALFLALEPSDPAFHNPITAAMRLYPTGVYSHSASLAALYKPMIPHGAATRRLSHRLVVTGAPFAPRAGAEGGVGGLFDNQPYWMTVDTFSDVDEFVLEVGEGGRVVGVESVGLGVRFERE